MVVINQYGKRIDRYRNLSKLRIERAIYRSNILTIQIDHRNLNSSEKRACKLFRGKRKSKHFCKK